MSKEAKGGMLIMIAAFFWGISGTIAKMIFNSSMNPFELANMRLNLSTLILVCYFYFFHRDILKIEKGEFKHLAILGAFGIMAVQTSYYFTISVLNVAMAIFLQFLAPIIITVYCVIFQKEKLNIIKISALVLALGGSYFIIFGAGSTGVPIKVIGIIVGLTSAFFSAFYTIYSKKCTSKHNPWTVLVYGLGTGAVLYWFISPPWIVWSGRSIEELLFALYIALFATIIPFGLYLCGMRYLMPTAAGVISMLEPVVASISAYLILGENMSFLQMLGGVSVIGAILILQFNASKKNEKEEIVQNIDNNVC